MFENIPAGVVGQRLPNGKVQVVKNVNGQVGEVFESDAAFNAKYQTINEGAGSRVLILDCING